MKGNEMYKATLTYSNSMDWGDEYTRTVEEVDQIMFYAKVVGNIKGNLAMGSTLINMEIE